MELNETNDFQNQVVIITGAASGIGRRVALDLIDKGAFLILVDLNKENLQKAFQKYKSDNIKLLEANVCSKGDRQKILDVSIKFGGPRYLVNAAGIIRVTPIYEVSEEEWDLVQNVNTKACFFLCQLVGEYWQKEEIKGAIVNFSSSAGKMSSTPEMIAYNVSKASIMALTKCLAHTLAKNGSRVNCVCPGVIKTPMQDKLQSEITGNEQMSRENRISRIPIGREGTSEEVSQVVLFLLSNSASYMTGQSINVTGGMIMY